MHTFCAREGPTELLSNYFKNTTLSHYVKWGVVQKVGGGIVMHLTGVSVIRTADQFEIIM